jgi:hypothetical protein
MSFSFAPTDNVARDMFAFAASERDEAEREREKLIYLNSQCRSKGNQWERRKAHSCQSKTNSNNAESLRRCRSWDASCKWIRCCRLSRCTELVDSIGHIASRRTVSTACRPVIERTSRVFGLSMTSSLDCLLPVERKQSLIERHRINEVSSLSSDVLHSINFEIFVY